MNILFEVTVLNGNTPKTLRMASASASVAGTQLDNQQWIPLITKRHSVSGSWASDGVLSEGSVNHGSLSFRMSSAYENEVWSSYEWNGGLARIFVGDDGDPFSAYKQVFEGSVSAPERQGITATVGLLGPDALLDRDLLSLEYQGTGGAEGPPALKGKLKPRSFGTCLSVEPTLVDAASWIYQVHGYGAVSAIKPYEFAQALDPAKNKGDQPTFNALKALTLVPGEWATCLQQGMFRLGGTPAQKISADVQSGGATTVATILPQLLTIASIPAAKQGNFSAFSSAAWSLYLDDQATVGEIARQAVYQAGGMLFADGTGKWQVMDYFAPATPIILNADRSTAPLVKDVREPTVSAPVWKVKVAYDRCWSVHTSSEVSPALGEISDKVEAQKAAAALALEAAQLAAAEAAIAKARLDAAASDGILDRAEKAGIVREFTEEAAQQNGLQTQPTNVDVTYERAVLAGTFGNLKTYLESLSPGYADSSLDTPIDRTTFDARWRDYWVAKQNLLNALAGRASATATWGQVTGPGTPESNATVGAPVGTNVGGRPVVDLLADTDKAKSDAAKAALDASNAKSAADAAAADTVAAKARLSAIEADGILDRSEKSEVVLRFNNAAAERSGLVAKGVEFDLIAQRNAYADAYDGLVAMLNGLSPSYTDTTTDTPIDRATFNAVWTRYFTERQNLLNAISSKTRVAAEAAQTNADKAAGDAAAAKLAADAAKIAADAAKATADATTANFTAARLTQILQKPIDDISKVTLDYGAQSLMTSKDLFDRNERSVRDLQTTILNDQGFIRVEKINELGIKIAEGVAGEATIRDAQIKDVKRLYQAGDAIVAADISTLGGRITKEVGDVKTAYEGAIRDTRQAVIDGDYAQALRADALSASITGLVQPGGNIYNLEAAVQRIDKAEVDNNGARAQETLNLKARLDNVNGASLEQSFTTYANKVDGIGAQYVLKVQTETNGVVSVAGMGLASSNGKSAIVFNSDVLQINVPGAGAVPVFSVDAQGVYMPNVRVNKLMANSVTINEIAPGLSRSPRFTASDVMIPSYEVTIIETPFFSVGFNNDATGTTENGSSLAIVSFTHDGSQVVDTAAIISVYVDTGSGYQVARTSKSGIATKDGNTVWTLKFTDSIAITASGAARVKITGQGVPFGNSPRNSGTYARQPEISILSIGR